MPYGYAGSRSRNRGIAARNAGAAPSSTTITLGDGSQITHTASPADALAAITTAANLCSQIDTYDARTWNEQQAFVSSIYSQIAAFYRYSNVSPQADPIYVKWWTDTYGERAGAVNYSDPAWSRRDGIGPLIVAPSMRNGIGKRFIDAWNLLGKYPINGTDRALDMLVPRIFLDDRAIVITECFGDSDRDQAPCAGFKVGFNLYGGCARAGATHEGCSGPDWRNMGWNDPLEIGIPAGPWSISALPPLRWFAEFACDLVNRIVTRQVTASDLATSTWLDALQYSLLWNVKVAQRFHQLPAALDAVAANLPDEQAIAELNAQQRNASVADSLAAAIPIATAINPIAGLAAGIFVGIVRIVSMVAPAAVGCETDAFGRCLPFALHVDIDGDPVASPPPVPTVGPSSRFASLRPTVADRFHAPQTATQRDTSASTFGSTPLLVAAALGVFLLSKAR